ncbi:hypothetical protein BRARA_I02032 [Brassica rapa]|nr:hypothetical protein BRARA_I02032 [Brassica rapa]
MYLRTTTRCVAITNVYVLPHKHSLCCCSDVSGPCTTSHLTATGFWVAAERLVSDASKKKHLKSFIEQAKEQLTEVDHQPTERSQGYPFEGHLTVDREPPQPQWLVQQNLMYAFSSIVAGESSNAADVGNILEDGGPPRAPPASKEVVKKLPVIVFSEEMLKTLRAVVECCIYKENLVIGDKMQELPCKHTFRLLCLKPWLDEHNSCPICRHELPTDDQKYESWKEREKEAEEERKGAENAVRGGEYMYL